MRLYPIQKIIDIITQELIPQVSYDKKIKLYEIAYTLDKIATGLSEASTTEEEAFDMLACYKEKEEVKC